MHLQEFTFKLKRVDHTWLIYRIDTVRTLSLAPVFPLSPV
jgi:hypothetical protein